MRVLLAKYWSASKRGNEPFSFANSEEDKYERLEGEDGGNRASGRRGSQEKVKWRPGVKIIKSITGNNNSTTDVDQQRESMQQVYCHSNIVSNNIV